jgi:L-alanine-DL-glutamate epimerase-like enolase superfamily enzyme
VIITNINCFVLESPAPAPRFAWRRGLAGEGDGTPAGEPTYSAVIQVETDEGICGCARAADGQAAASLVRRRLKKLIGRDPLMTEALWHEVWEIDRIEEMHMRHLGLLDLALWDIKSRRAGMPVHQLIGGNANPVAAYASTVTWATMDEYERNIKLCAEVGFTAFKLHAWGDAREDARLASNLRQWVGDEAELMFDGSAGWDYVTSLRFGRVLEDLNYLWYEEPMREFDLVSYSKLCHDLEIPVLAAETSNGCHWNAATWIDNKALDMMRVSVDYKGGITGAMKIAHLAESFGMRAQVHGMGWGNAQLCAALPNNDYYEQLVIDEARIRGLKDQPHLPIVEGRLQVPQEPGLEPHPDWEALQRSAVLIV